MTRARTNRHGSRRGDVRLETAQAPGTEACHLSLHPATSMEAWVHGADHERRHLPHPSLLQAPREGKERGWAGPTLPRLPLPVPEPLGEMPLEGIQKCSAEEPPTFLLSLGGHPAGSLVVRRGLQRVWGWRVRVPGLLLAMGP